MSTPFLEISHVEHSFRTGFWMRRAQVLHDLSFSVPRGSVFGFLGANGAGKTTLIHLMIGLMRPTAGTIRVGGFDSSDPRARVLFGYLPERPYFYDHLTGRALLSYCGTLAGMGKAGVQKRIPEVLSEVGMTHASEVQLRKYSKGMLQRIGIAQALIHDPECLVLDEPMSGLDPLGRKEMRELIIRLASKGKTVFFSSHVIPDVESICDQVALLKKGRLIGCGAIGEFLSRGNLQTEIAFSGVPFEKAKSIKGLDALREIPDGVRGIADSQQSVGEALSALLKINARILWVTPLRPSLEDLFGGGE